ncbi:orotidine 5'-phosphate decarboxylase [Trichinella spiralis]|uniref:orotidine 5'-phosphate decarboxylase n=1 Tax=Trichinella spiralis TaxID=6334 RepID=UPI0001EFB29A|nr:orotidine 5'-phosphate decarboxylase [Trichinella spiralis]
MNVFVVTHETGCDEKFKIIDEQMEKLTTAFGGISIWMINIHLSAGYIPLTGFLANDHADPFVRQLCFGISAFPLTIPCTWPPRSDVLLWIRCQCRQTDAK